MLRARAALAARIDLAPLADVAADAADILVVDLLHLIDAERADLAARSARTAGSTGPATIAATTTVGRSPAAVRRTRPARGHRRRRSGRAAFGGWAFRTRLWVR